MILSRQFLLSVHRKPSEISWSFARENQRSFFYRTFKKCSSKKCNFIDFDIARISFAFLHSIIVRRNRRGMLLALLFCQQAKVSAPTKKKVIKILEFCPKHSSYIQLIVCLSSSKFLAKRNQNFTIQSSTAPNLNLLLPSDSCHEATPPAKLTHTHRSLTSRGY